MTKTAEQFIDELDGLHVYGEDITVNDADLNYYTQETCACSTGLGHHLSMEAHRAQVLEQYVQERIAEAVSNNHTAVLTRVIAQIADLDREMNGFPSVPMHIHAILAQIGTQAAIDADLLQPRQEQGPE